MTANSWNFLFIGARLFLVVCALAPLPTYAATTTLPTQIRASNCAIANINTTRVLTASSIRTMQIVEDLDADDIETETTGSTESKRKIVATFPISTTPLIDMSIKKCVRRPEFIPECAFTNEEMVAPYHDIESINANAVSTQELPKRIKLNPSVARHWVGAKVQPFWVNTMADKDHPGTYSFSSEIKGGPKGWLQNTGERSAWGHPEYRYWFDPS